MVNETEVHFKDFTKKRKRIIFRLDPDEFECVPALMPDALQEIMIKFRSDEFTKSVKERDVEAVFGSVRDMYSIFLLDDEHYDRFVARLSDRHNPIDIHQLVEIIHWVIEKYTNRPTEPSPSSSDSPETDDGGTSLTAGALPVESPHLSLTDVTFLT